MNPASQRELVHGPNQDHLVKLLKCLFPSDDVIVESRKKSSLKYDTGGYVELDIWLPKYSLCFEFQDTYHYVDAWYSHRSLDEVQQNDDYKKASTLRSGMTLIDIPCWWDGVDEGLVASIHFRRPDIFLNNSKMVPISLNPPISHFTNVAIPGVGQLMLASFPANKFMADSDASSWWLGEKYDGIRCCWNSSKRRIYTRTGRSCELLPRIEAYLPRIFLDAELWIGRGGFSQTQRLVSGGDIALVKWHMLRVNAFDVPSRNMQSRPFEERYSYLLSHTLSKHPVIIVAPRILCDGELFLDSMLSNVIERGGEGIILRSLGSLYEHGRTNSLIKLKGHQGDKDAVVVGLGSDKSISLKLPSGLIFSVSRQNVLVPRITIGDVATFSYENFAKKSEFVNPTIFRIRTDVTWPEVVYNSRESQTWSKVKERERKSARRFWTEKAMRGVLEESANKKQMDPLLPDTWFHISPADVEQVEGGKSVLQHCKGYIPALQSLFPDIGINFDELSQFHSLHKWNDVANRRKFFEKMAASQGFDPLIAANWYTQTKETIMSYKGASTILRYYNGNIPRALMSIFPDIGLNRTRMYNEFSEDTEKKRKFFEEYAKQNNFDPQISENWYLQPATKILASKGSQAVMHSYNNNIPNALCNIFPNIGLVKSHFVRWKITSEQRRVFESYAERHSFDPYTPSHWYQQPRERFLSFKGAHGILKHYSGSMARALVTIFPDIGLEKEKFSRGRG